MPILKGIQWPGDVYKGFVIEEPDTGKYSIASVITITIKFPTNITQKANLWNINYKKSCIYRHAVFTSYLGLGSLGNKHWDQCFHVWKYPGAQHLQEDEGRTGWGGELWLNPEVVSTHPRGALELRGPPRLSCILQSAYLDLLSLPLPMGGVTLGESARSATTSKRAQLRSCSQASSPFLKGRSWVAHHSIHHIGTDLLVLFSFCT